MSTTAVSAKAKKCPMIIAGQPRISKGAAQVQTDPATGKPTVHDFAYRVIYRWTSHFVHPTIAALMNHVVQAGKDNFTVRSGNLQDMTHLAVFNVASYMSMTMVCFYRCMGDPQPERVGTWSGALIKHLARRHN